MPWRAITVAVALALSAAGSTDVASCVNDADRREFGGLCRYRQENEALLAAHTRPRVVMMGDSITEGWIAGDPSIFRDGVVDRGIGGQITAQMLVRFRQDVIDLKPRAVHIMGGTNDVLHLPGPVNMDQAVSNIRSMGELARAHGIRVIIASVIPASQGGAPVKAVAEINRRLSVLARQEHYQFVDYYRVLDKGDGSMSTEHSGDGVHPTEAGYAVMRPLAAKAIASVR
jgi:lysophospholipase L1-like esterase